MNSFLLWRADAKRESLPATLRAAAKRYLERFGVTPNTFFVNPADARRDYRVGNLTILRKSTILAGYVGATHKAN